MFGIEVQRPYEVLPAVQEEAQIQLFKELSLNAGDENQSRLTAIDKIQFLAESTRNALEIVNPVYFHEIEERIRLQDSLAAWAGMGTVRRLYELQTSRLLTSEIGSLQLPYIANIGDFLKKDFTNGVIPESQFPGNRFVRFSVWKVEEELKRDARERIGKEHIGGAVQYGAVAMYRTLEKFAPRLGLHQ